MSQCCCMNNRQRHGWGSAQQSDSQSCCRWASRAMIKRRRHPPSPTTTTTTTPPCLCSVYLMFIMTSVYHPASVFMFFLSSWPDIFNLWLLRSNLRPPLLRHPQIWGIALLLLPGESISNVFYQIYSHSTSPITSSPKCSTLTFNPLVVLLLILSVAEMPRLLHITINCVTAN